MLEYYLSIYLSIDLSIAVFCHGFSYNLGVHVSIRRLDTSRACRYARWAYRYARWAYRDARCPFLFLAELILALNKNPLYLLYSPSKSRITRLSP